MTSLLAPTRIEAPRGKVVTQTQPVPAPKPIRPPVRIPASFDPENINGQLITLPTSLTNKLNLTKSVNLKWGGQSYIIPPNCFFSTGDGLKVLLPSGTLNNTGGGSVTGSATSSGGLTLNNSQVLASSTMNKKPMQSLGQIAPLTGTPQNAVRTTTSVGAPVPRVIAPVNNQPPRVISISPDNTPEDDDDKQVKVKNVPACYFQRVQGGFDAMMHLFSFFSAADLVR